MGRRSYNRPRGSSMTPTSRPCRGFSLIELLVVLVIVGILAMVGVTMIGNRPSGSVRAVMDELEGVIASAHKRAVATGRDVVLNSQGDWNAATPMRLTYTGAAPADDFNLAVTANGAGLAREHMHAGVVTDAAAGWWATTIAGSTAISAGPPFLAGSDFLTILNTSTLNLFRGAPTIGNVRISGANKRFATSFWIQVVAIQNGAPIPGGPHGLILVQANGATIYRFYNPGIINGGNGAWRRM